MKRCPMCERTLDLSHYGLQTKRGKLCTKAYCKPCCVDRERARVAALRGEPAPKPSEVTEARRLIDAAFMQWAGGEPRQDWRVRV